MIRVSTVEFKPGTKEELLPNFEEKFPYLLSQASFHYGHQIPWHWHKAVELFYIESGTLEYITPNQRHVFPAGSGGLVNSNVLHMTIGQQTKGEGCNRLHLFDPVLIAGHPGSLMEEKYVLPLTTAAQIEMIPLEPGLAGHGEILGLLRESLNGPAEEPGYELRLRGMLSEIWVGLLKIAEPLLEQEAVKTSASEQVKEMMVYIHEHYGERLSVRDIAGAACVSERTCFSLFQKNLRTTPVEYLNSYRLRMACQMLTQTGESVTDISAACGMTNSYFCQMFRESTGFTPLEYRRFYQRHQHSLNGQWIR